jgi:hypothetical protein
MFSARSAFLVVCLSVVGSSLPACTAATDEGEPEPGETESALTTCGSVRYAEALGHYKAAVAGAKGRLAQGACESNNGLLWPIADQASQAVMSCGEFRNIIRTSPWAAPLRTALAPSLTLPSLTGELSVIKDSDFQNWTGVDRFFSRGGLKFHAHPQGAYGSAVTVEFRTGGKAVWGEQTYEASTGNIGWREISATFTITKSNGRESGPRLVTVTRAGKTERFALSVRNPINYKNAPVFVLVPLGTGSVLGQGANAPELLSLVSECDA